MSDDDLKILTRHNNVVTLREYFEGERETRREQARLPFEEKIRILVTLQMLAVEWGGKKDVIVWEVQALHRNSEGGD
ncbi:MAG: hypothetical protein FJ215_00415 [Ignavibacteria bacterium]|nr:hypothetical protein [Ignavibacteria bacterium]